jgi:hypothetical protein
MGLRDYISLRGEVKEVAKQRTAGVQRRAQMMKTTKEPNFK